MYAKIAMTTWTLDEPARSTLEGGFVLTHEPDCPAQYPYDMHGCCTCCVSRVRLVETPAGDVLPTTEPDLRTNVKFWHNEAKRLQRQSTILAVCLLLSASSGIATTIGFASKLGWL